MISSAVRGSAFALAVVLLLTLTPARPTEACLTVGGADSNIQIADEEAIIVWDAAAHREDFIRQATFRTQARDFGFLVPTPSVPTLAAVGGAVFPMLEHLGARTLGRSLMVPEAEPMETNGVAVLRTQRVGGYQATVLAADDTTGLAKWLRGHGYAVPPSMADWLAPYLRAHWTITAFKVARDAQSAPTATLPPVRLSFTTSQPFYPYREPPARLTVGKPMPLRMLRVFLLSSCPMAGGFADAARRDTWPGRASTTHNLDGFDAEFRSEIARKLALTSAQMPHPLWMTMFEDHSSPRPAVADVYFRPSPAKAASR